MGMKKYRLFVSLLSLSFATTLSAYMKEPECTCSKFHYEEQLLEKMIRTEMKFQALQEQIDAKLGDFSRNVEDMSAAVDTRLNIFQKRSEEFVRMNGGIINGTVGKIEKMAELIKGMSLERKVSFSSKKAADITLDAGQVIVFQEVLYNTGSGYDSSTGKFTAPVEGTYLFTCQLCQDSSDSIHYGIVVDGTDVTRGYFSTGNSICTSFDAIVELKTSQNVWIQAFHSDTLLEDQWRWNMFSGVRLH